MEKVKNLEPSDVCFIYWKGKVRPSEGDLVQEYYGVKLRTQMSSFQNTNSSPVTFRTWMATQIGRPNQAQEEKLRRKSESS